MVEVVITLNSTLLVIRGGQRVLTNEVYEGDLVPGYGPKDPVTHADTDGTYEEFVAAYTKARTPQRGPRHWGPNYNL